MSRIPNPYIVGTPIPGQEFFYGREDLLSFVRDTINPPQQRVVVLYGQRRIGKTSVLYELARRLSGEFHPVYFDLMGQANRPLPDALHEIASQINDALNLEPPPPFSDPHQFRTFLKDTCSGLADGRPLLLLLDEFDDLSDQNVIAEAAALTLFDYLRDLLNVAQPVAFVFVVGRRLTELPQNFQSILKQAPSRRVAFLNETETGQLITQPAREILAFTPEAIDAVNNLTSGHPYFTQLICFELFRRAMSQGNGIISTDDVTAVLDRALETGKGGLAWFWDGLPLAERFVMSAIAEISGPDATASTEEVRRLLDSYDLRFLGLEVTDAPNLLVQWEILRDTGAGYQFTVDLVRRWILAEHPLAQAKRDVENLSPRANRYFANARESHQAGDLGAAVGDYRRALEANPNHLRAQLGLAQALAEQGDPDAAHQAFQKAYDLDQGSAREGLALSYEKLAVVDQKNGRLKEAIAKLEQAQGIAETRARGRQIETLKLALAEQNEQRQFRLKRLRYGLGTLGGLAAIILLVVAFAPQLSALFSRDSEPELGVATAMPDEALVLIADFDTAAELGLNPEANLELALGEAYPSIRFARASGQIINSKNMTTLTRDLMKETGAAAVIFGWAANDSIGTNIAFYLGDDMDIEIYSFDEYINTQNVDLTGAELSQKFAPGITQQFENLALSLLIQEASANNMGQVFYMLAAIHLQTAQEKPDSSDGDFTEADHFMAQAYNAGVFAPAVMVDNRSVEILFVPSGDFERGRTEKDLNELCQRDGTDCSGDRGKSEPVALVYLDWFLIDRNEVTNVMYQECAVEGACSDPVSNESFDGQEYYNDPERSDKPVIWVSWAQAQAFCQWRNGRLPTEAEWEKAARWQPTEGSLVYPWGNAPPSPELANYTDTPGSPMPIGSHPEGGSPIGANDMAGNVWEWVSDWFDPNYYEQGDVEEPQGPANGELKVFRGGSFNSYIVDPAFRAGHDPGGNPFTGFRCAFDNPYLSP